MCGETLGEHLFLWILNTPFRNQGDVTEREKGCSVDYTGICRPHQGGVNLTNKGITSQQTRGIHPMLFQCYPTVFDAGPTLQQHWINTVCLLP